MFNRFEFGGLLFKQESQEKIDWWPSLQDYNEAIQLHQSYVEDAQLKSGRPYENAMGLPRAVTGAFSTVYRIESSNQDLALKLFLKDIHDQEARYALISNFLAENKSPYFVSFQYLKNGIKVKGNWFPGLKMDWVEGLPIDEYIVQNIDNSAKLGELAESFLKMMEHFRSLGLAHGDLQHGNIIMCGDDIRVVDYDGMFVPSMRSFASCEVGHRNYQHPKRSALHFATYLDNFSAWLIYASIKALQLDPKLLNQLGGADDCLLFRETDFLNPMESAAFAAFERHPDSALNALSKFIRAQLAHDISQIPYLQSTVPAVQSVLSDIPAHVSTIKAGPRLVRGNPDEWLDSDNLNAARKEIEGRGQVTPLQDSWTVQAKDGAAATWVRPGTAAPYPVSHDVTVKDNVAIPFELKGPTPRKVKIRRFLLIWNHVVCQGLLLLLWCVIWWTAHNMIFIDRPLKMTAKEYSGTVVETEIRTSSGKNSSTTTDVTYHYVVRGVPYNATQTLSGEQRSYSKGTKVIIYADPSNPTWTEPLNSYPGKSLENDWSSFCFLLSLCLFLELLVWWRIFVALFAVRSGTPILATIRNMSSFGKGTCCADLCFTIDGKREKSGIILNAMECSHLGDGDTVVALYVKTFVPRLPILQIYDFSPIITK
jgi:hypothetical protein